ncbi:hypothetical protein DCC81_04305 [Chitinophaga parva]|uniref:DUF4843 domain-containing protein n=1 Tax=Chitinophaga parva TaxID=2169414 RepID=A0A2T7BM04_9BACT|nr:DUF4843 domain-containing protein [Chitinophaga parva]PUZ28713.1 hypothetical protein DCC81_04305 [Chitinophaga parva]
MKKFFCYIILGAGALLAACTKNDPASIYNTPPNIYFDWRDSTGAGALKDSLVFSFAFTPERTVDTALLPIRISGDRMPKDRIFKLAIVDSATTAKAGLHFKALEPQYIMPADSGFVKVPVYLYAADTSLHSHSVKLRVKLLPTSDFTVTDTLFNVAKISFSNMLQQPEWWAYWSQLGPYSRVSFELLILSTGTTVMYPPADFTHQPAMMFICSSFTSFIKDPFSFVTKHPSLNLVTTANGDGTYSLYATNNPDKKWILYPEGGAYYFHDENGVTIKL